MKKHPSLRLVALVLLASVALASCGSSVNMHRHNRSSCDCPRFD